jgi:hypothetical protein
LREWVDIQADLFAMAEANDPGAAEREVAKEAAKARVAALRANGDS